MNDLESTELAIIIADLLCNMKDLDPDISAMVDEYFWELLA